MDAVRRGERATGMDAGQIIHLPHPFSAFPNRPSIQPSCGNPSPGAHALIAAYGDAMGLPMDWTKSRALCNPTTPPTRGHPCPSLFTPNPPVALILRGFRKRLHPEEERRVYSFQFARVVHSTGDRKILGEGIIFSFFSFRVGSTWLFYASFRADGQASGS